MVDQMVSLPDGILASSQKQATIELLAGIGRFVRPNMYQPYLQELALTNRFATTASIGFADATAWLSENAVKTGALDNQVLSALNGDAEPLHQSLQTANDNGSLVLMAVQDGSKLLDANGIALWSKAEPVLLLRAGYAKDQPVGYYAASLPGDSQRLLTLAWDSLVAAGITAAVEIKAPPPQIDYESLSTVAHILQQATDTLQTLVNPAPVNPPVQQAL